ncbi:MAG: hypothetical protein ACAI43_25475 [Phycisphaerae bacterium]
MRLARYLPIVLAALLCAAPSLAAPPTPAQIQEKYAAADYRGALAGIAQALALKPGSDEGYDRYALLMLKGECLVQLGSQSLAADAFEDAREATDHLGRAAAAKANEIVLRKALAFKYVPKTGTDKNAIDIKPADGRLRAMNALRADLLAQNKVQIGTAAQAGNLEPLLKLMPVLRQIATLEIGATGDLVQSRPMLVELGTHARTLIVAELRRCRMEVEAMNGAANEVWVNDDQVGRRGLYTKERRELAGTGDYVRRIEETAREGRRIARLLGGAADAWEQIVADSGDLVTRIDIILKRVD